MRLSTSRNQANGSIFTSSHDVTKLRRTAAVLPPVSLPKNVQLFRPTAKHRNDLSVPLLSMARSVTALARQCLPVLQCVGDRLPRRALRQHLLAYNEQLRMQLRDH